jgi:hypothetical protein
MSSEVSETLRKHQRNLLRLLLKDLSPRFMVAGLI